MRIDINLASQPYEDARRFWLRWGVGLSALAVVTLFLIYMTISGWFAASKDRAMIAQRQAQIAERDREKAAAEAMMNLPQNRSTRDRSQFLNELFLRKSFSWTQVFEDLERVMPARLHVVSIQPDMGKDNQLLIRLHVAGDSRERASELVQKMEGSARFQQTYIEQESVSQSQTPGDNESFDISALYVPALPEPAEVHKPEERVMPMGKKAPSPVTNPVANPASKVPGGVSGKDQGGH